MSVNAGPSFKVVVDIGERVPTAIRKKPGPGRVLPGPGPLQLAEAEANAE